MIGLKPCPFSRRDIYVWVAYQKEKPYLPIAIGTTAEELAKTIGVRVNTVYASWMRYSRGEIKRTRYHCVKVGVDDENW